MVANVRDMLSDITHFDKYARYMPEQGRRETFKETVDRSKQMMLRNLASSGDLSKDMEIAKQINWAYSFVYDKKVLPSMRNLQFAGPAIEQNHARIYNCWYAPIDNDRVISELVFLLLSGGGCGYSVRKRHVDQLPAISKVDPYDIIIHKVEDTIEGWAEAVRIRLHNYWYGGPKIEFDWSGIRPKGSLLKTSGGRAPGPEKIRESLDMIDELLMSVEIGRKLTPLEVHKIVCIAANAVKAGGIRRSALICGFDADDEEMTNCKSGNWYEHSLYLQNANNSACFEDEDDAVAIEKFRKFWERAKLTKSGDPGFVRCGWHDFFNPCLAPFSKVIIKDKGLSDFSELEIGDQIWSETGWTTVVNKWSTGVKEVLKYRTSAGEFVGTANHRIVSNGVKVAAGSASSIDRLVGPQDEHWNLDAQFVMDGLVFGDGVFKAECRNPVYLLIGNKDQDYFSSEVGHLIGDRHVNGKITDYNVITNMPVDTMRKRVWERNIPEYIWNATDSEKASFLRGLYSANGSVVGDGGRVTLKGTNKDMIYDVQKILNSLGFRSYVTINQSKDVKFANGIYNCKESYDLNITTDRILFRDKIGFIQEYKNDKIKDFVIARKDSSCKNNFEIKEVISLGYHEVFDITVDNAPHTFWSDGSNVSNCGEVNLRPNQACNLTELNGRLILTQQDLEDFARAGAIIATCQAWFTNFHYLSPRWKETTEKEALIGVGITGITDGQVLNLDLKMGAEIVKQTNAMMADLLGINRAARCTVIKPSGTTSCVLGCSSGIHDWHYRYFVRHAALSKSTPLYKFLAEKSPDLVVDDVMKPGEAFIAYPMKVDDNVPVAGDLTAIDFLERVKHVLHDWVLPGTNYGELRNNVSSTVTIADDEWDDVLEWICANWKDVRALSWTPKFETTPELRAMYPQPPFMGITKEEYEERVSKLKEFDISELKEEDDQTALQGEAACAGGACEVI